MTNYTWRCTPLLRFTTTCLGLVTALHVSSYILILIDASGLGFELKHLCQQSKHADGSLTRSTLPIQNDLELIGSEWSHFRSAHSLLYHSKIAYRNVLWQLIPVTWKKLLFSAMPWQLKILAWRPAMLKRYQRKPSSSVPRDINPALLGVSPSYSSLSQGAVLPGWALWLFMIHAPWQRGCQREESFRGLSGREPCDRNLLRATRAKRSQRWPHAII